MSAATSGHAAGGAVRPAARPRASHASRAIVAALVVISGSCLAIAAEGQERLAYGIRPEARADVLFARSSAVHVGAGVSIAPATYLRVSLIAAGGTTIRTGDRVGSGRVELIGRFVLDPFRQHRLGGYAGAGLGIRGEEGDCCRPLLILVAGVEGPHVRGRTTALEAGYGGGVRVGLAVRSTPRRIR